MGKPNKNISFIDKNKDKTRINALSRVRGLKQEISTLSKEYGVDPKLVAYRLGHEGFLDVIARNANPYKKSLTLEDDVLPYMVGNINTFKHFGLDNSFDYIQTGKTKLHRFIPIVKDINVNERGNLVNTAATESPYDALELFIADIAGRQNRASKRGYKGNDLIKATNRAFNAGEYSNLPLNKYNILPYDTITFPKPKKYRTEYKDNQFNNQSTKDILNYMQQVSRWTKDYDTGVLYSGFGNYDTSYIPLRSIDALTPFSERNNQSEINKQFAEEKIKDIIRKNTNIKIKNDNKTKLSSYITKPDSYIKKFTLSGKY